MSYRDPTNVDLGVMEVIYNKDGIALIHTWIPNPSVREGPMAIILCWFSYHKLWPGFFLPDMKRKRLCARCKEFFITD